MARWLRRYRHDIVLAVEAFVKKIERRGSLNPGQTFIDKPSFK
jgi:hypothetical protein